MASPVPIFAIRCARPNELDELVRVDDDACGMFAEAGLHLDLQPEHPFSRTERSRWHHAISEGLVQFAHDEAGTIAGAVVMRWVDGLAYVKQREWLPEPQQRVVMRRDPSPPGQG